MPLVRLHRDGETYEQEVDVNSNLVVLAGLRIFPQLKYGCGIGKCGKCRSRILKGAEQLGPPNWKEERKLGELMEEGYRLMCQQNITEDIEISQDNLKKLKVYNVPKAKLN
jgi:ferredoxin